MEYWQILIIILVPLAFLLVVFKIINNKQIEKSKKYRNSNFDDDGVTAFSKRRFLKFPMYFKIILLTVIIFCACLAIYVLISQLEDWPYLLILFGFFGFPALISFVLISLWRVEIYKDSFIYRNYFGKKKEYKYSDLVYLEHPKGLKWYFLKDGKKVFCMLYYIEDGHRLYKAFKKYKIKNK